MSGTYSIRSGARRGAWNAALALLAASGAVGGCGGGSPGHEGGEARGRTSSALASAAADDDADDADADPDGGGEASAQDDSEAAASVEGGDDADAGPGDDGDDGDPNDGTAGQDDSQGSGPDGGSPTDATTGGPDDGSDGGGLADGTLAGDASDDGPGCEAGSCGDSAPGGDGGPVQCTDYSANKNLYWGELHVHTALSVDAYKVGTRNFPLDAYRFASDPSTRSPIAAGAPEAGPSVSIDRRLDWAAVTDHGEWLAGTWGCGAAPDGGPVDPASPYFSSVECAAVRQISRTTNGVGQVERLFADQCDGGLGGACPQETRSAWAMEIRAAHDAYQRCQFTTFVGYEWTHGTGEHQNVIFSSEAVPAEPFSSDQYRSTGSLWNALDRGCTADAGCSALTIPHNSNMSDGLAFALPVGAAATAQMNRYQRLVEIFQSKGSSECAAGATDPQCGFEHLPYAGRGSNAPTGFVRQALGSGIAAYAAQREAGVKATDPLEMGVVAAADDHNGMPGYVAEEGFQGHRGIRDDTPAGRLGLWYFNPGGITGVWAEQNTREAIFGALYRREVFGTSGPRISVRFYQVWGSADYCGADAGASAFPANVLAAGGVPMGGRVSAGRRGRMEFVVSALEDTDPLAEIDLVKASVVGGSVVEQIVRFVPATSPGAFSRGSACLTWQDLHFDPTTPAVYYARVLQVPTWRWSHADCQADPSARACADGGVDTMVQERAWTSPIWWLP